MSVVICIWLEDGGLIFSSFRYEQCLNRLLSRKNIVRCTHDYQISVISYFYTSPSLLNPLRYILYSALSEVCNIVYVTASDAVTQLKVA